jgi:hypothetical protein
MNQYESVYGVGMLDDLHNYFPELLYNSNFESPMLSYLRRQTRDRFDLFSRGERRWREANNVPAPGFGARARAASFRPMAATPLVTPIHSTLPAASNADLLTTRILLSLMTMTPSESFLQPIIVRPTAEQISRNTLVGHVASDETVTCAICQDTLSPEQEGRKLLACSHWFHRGCIDTWFTRDVHCPNCRHDVRNLPVEPEEAD